MRLLLPVALIFLATSCGDSKRDTDDAAKKPLNNGDATGKVDPTDSWFGLVTKCLVDAQEVKDSTFITVKQTITCSPLMSGKDMSDVTAKLDLWKKANCPARVDIRGGTPGNYNGCYITPYGAQNAVSTDKSSVSGKAGDAELCTGKQGALYGSIKCN